MRRHAILAGIAGLVLVALSAGWSGLVATLHPVCGDYAQGILWVGALQLVSLTLCAVALRCVTPGTSLWGCVAARWISDGVSNLMAILPGCGEAAGIRALVLFNTSASLAASGIAVDTAVEAASQAAYTVLGLGLLVLTTQGLRLQWWAAAMAVAGACIITAVTYVVVHHQRSGASVERALTRLTRNLPEWCTKATSPTFAAIRSVRRNRGQIGLAFFMHLVAWISGAVQVWAAARAIDRPVGLGTALVMDSLTQAARGVAFMMPCGLGVQEGGFAIVGSILGFDAAGALGLSLMLRGRDLVIGCPAVLAWGAAEAHRWRTRSRRPFAIGARRRRITSRTAGNPAFADG